VEGEVDLSAWMKAAVGFLKRRGRLTIIHRADRLGHLLAALDRLPVGAITVFPLWPRAGKAAIRVIVSARRDMKTPLEVLPGLVLHHDDGSFTTAAQDVLRRGTAVF
jgi:tRNA1(Val) A37 N6-methylase TrmN6